MSEFIKEFGKDNFVIMLVIVGIIVLILITILIIERRNSKKIIRREINSISDKEVEKNNVEKQTVVENFTNDNDVEVLEEPTEYDEKEKVYYAPNETTVEEAKEKLEEVTKRLIDEVPSDLIDHTNFETEQEEKSIISYEELIKASHDIDEKNDRLLEDEGEAAITLEELYKKHQEEQSIIDGIDAVNEKSKVSNPVFEEEKKFKNSEVISPVFGVYTGEVKPKTVLKELDKKVGPKDLEDEIQRTEDFLSELKKLKNKLD